MKYLSLVAFALTACASSENSRTTLRERLHASLKVKHPYETPSIFFIEPAGADEDTIGWIAAETDS